MLPKYWWVIQPDKKFKILFFEIYSDEINEGLG